MYMYRLLDERRQERGGNRERRREERESKFGVISCVWSPNERKLFHIRFMDVIIVIIVIIGIFLEWWCAV